MISFYYSIDLNNFVWIDHERAERPKSCKEFRSAAARESESEREKEKIIL